MLAAYHTSLTGRYRKRSRSVKAKSGRGSKKLPKPALGRGLTTDGTSNDAGRAWRMWPRIVEPGTFLGHETVR
jgi:hypothetical protein